MVKRQVARSILLAPFARAVATALASPRTCSHHTVRHALSSCRQQLEECRIQQLCKEHTEHGQNRIPDLPALGCQPAVQITVSSEYVNTCACTRQAEGTC